jgi:integrase
MRPWGAHGEQGFRIPCMAYIEHLPSGKWRAQIRRRGHPQQSDTFDLKGHAEAWARKVERAMDRGEFVELSEEASKMTLRKALEKYEESVTPAKRGAKQELVRIAAWKAHKLAQRPLASVKAHELATHRDERLRAGKSPNTVRLELAVLSHLYAVARADWGFTGLPNPAQEITKPSTAGRARKRRLEGDEEKQLLAKAPGVAPWLAPAIVLLIETAMRRGELATLEWDQIDGVSHVARLELTKNGDERTVPLTARAVAALHELGGEKLPKSGRILPAGPDRLSHAFIEVCELAGIYGLTLHGLRHEATSRLFELGRLQLPEVAAITGHRTWAMLKRYTHPRAADLAKKMRAR